jgi:hypothetical protein
MLAEPVPCTVIEEVGSTGVGAMALAFIIMAVATVIFLAKAWGSPEHKRFARNCTSVVMMRVHGWIFLAATICARHTWLESAALFISQCSVVKDGTLWLDAGSSSGFGTALSTF